ncbi:cytochrome B [Leuconostoc palmae]|uniref:cytochrome B n=1 Tax=Leuconostoc palmae TaxID=501487 RepID=UPI001C7CB5B0|nr:cytochrome B [Leuconostoc palmae]
MMIKQKIYKYYPYLIIILIGIFLAWPQLKYRGMYIGADTSFHFNRAFEAMNRLKYVNFNNLDMSLYGFNQSGRIINEFYGPGLGYCFGLILLLTKSWFKFQLISNFILTIGTLSFSYWLFNKYSKQRLLSLSFSIMISLTTYWSLAYWYRSSGGMPWGMMLLPFVIDASIQMISNNTNPVRLLRLGIVMSLILECHTLSFVFAVLIIAVFFSVAMISRNDRWLIFKKTVLSAIICCSLTFNYWINYFYITKTQSIFSPFVNNNPSNLSTKLSEGLTFWLIIMSLFFIISEFKRLVIYEWSLVLLGMGFAFIASCPPIIAIFWNNISFFKIAQFPMRFTMPSIYLLSIFVISNMRKFFEHNKIQFKSIFAISVALIIISGPSIISFFKTNQEINNNYSKNSDILASKLTVGLKDNSHVAGKILGYRNQNFDKSISVVDFIAPDYLQGSGSVIFSGRQYTSVINNIVLAKGFQKEVLKSGNLKVSWQQKSESDVQLPVAGYKQTKVRLNGEKVKISVDKNGLLNLKGQKGQNIAVINFEEPNWLNLSRVVPYLTIMIIILYFCLRKKRIMCNARKI